MTLINDLFVVLETTVGEMDFTATIELNPGHIVYSGHFPGHPVTPAVIQLQIVHELLEMHFRRNLKLITMSRCKFLKILNPNETPRLVVYTEFNNADDFLNIEARGKNGAGIFFKINPAYQFI